MKVRVTSRVHHIHPLRKGTVCDVELIPRPEGYNAARFSHDGVVLFTTIEDDISLYGEVVEHHGGM